MRAFLLVLLLAGCTASNSAERWAGTVDTLGNGVIQVTNPATGLWGEGGSGWQLERELELGSADGPEPLIFATVSGIEADADGRIYVLDREANQLKIFTGTGGHVRTPSGRTPKGSPHTPLTDSRTSAYLGPWS